jgi:hypothetical protein
LQRISPTDEPSLANYKRIMEPAWRRTLQLEWPVKPSRTEVKSLSKKPDHTCEEWEMARAGGDETIKLLHFTPAHFWSRPVAMVLAHPDGARPYVDGAGEPVGLARQCLDKGLEVVVVADAGAAANADQTSILFSTYNRTRLQERVRDLVGICAEVRNTQLPGRRVVLFGSGRAGPWSLLAAPAADAVIADCGQLDVSDDQTLLDPDLFCPGIRNIDTFAGAPILAAPHPLVMFNAAPSFTTSNLLSSYRALHAEKKLRVESRPLEDDKIVAAVLSLW